MFSYCAPPASWPEPRLTARSMLSFGTEDFFAFWMASYSVGLPAGSPPPVRAATSTFLISLANSLPRLASTTAFLCLVVAHFEWPLIKIAAWRLGHTAGRNAAPSLQVMLWSKLSAIAKQAFALPGAKPRQGMPWMRGEATGLPGL